ncbi:(d)CMP kinase [Alkalicoccus chagannorensis]|uniref:(d)CMP kinase n=1 Tax=Alkalicoccus chagannorensis TaxID=427072 RepID=UPI000404EE4C|nr:(d)CMP kinase [Alkalicoccus chagannorensis]
MSSRTDSRANIAVDGPAGAGKSTAAKLLAERLGFDYIDTGAMYRALTWKAVQEKVDVHNEQELERLLQEMKLVMKPAGGEIDIFADDRRITEEVRSSEVTNQVSYTAAHQKIRSGMVEKQKRMASGGGCVMDGRDIGTAVLPDASFKFFLTAEVEERARRRHLEQLDKGIESDLETLKEEIASRDKLDSERETAPLRKASDAVEIDTTSMSLEEVVEKMYKIITKRVNDYE